MRVLYERKLKFLFKEDSTNSDEFTYDLILKIYKRTKNHSSEYVAEVFTPVDPFFYLYSVLSPI